MKDLFKSSRFKLIIVIIALLLVGMTLCAANGHGETAQSGIIGTIFTPAHWVASKISNGIDSISENAKGNAEYDAKIDSLQKQLGELQDQLADYNNLKAQNDLYKDALGLKEEHKDFEFAEASVIGRDSVIKKAYPTYSVVTTILDPDFSVSAYDISTNELSFVSGDAELAQKGICKFENLSSSSKISYGSIIATAGISKKMPKGIIIGTVKDISNEEKDISSYASIEPGTDIEKLTSVLILTNYSESEGK